MPTRSATHGIARLQPIECFKTARAMYVPGTSPIPQGREYKVQSDWMLGLILKDGTSSLSLSWDDMRENGIILDPDGVELDFDQFDQNPPKNYGYKKAAPVRLPPKEMTMPAQTRFDRINDTPPAPVKPKKSKKPVGNAVAPPPPVDTRSVSEKVRDGAYKVTNLEYPSQSDPDKRAKRHAYQAAQDELYTQFKQDLFREHDVIGNPKAELCFTKAWAMGHASGVSEVEIYFSDLVELIK